MEYVPDRFFAGVGYWASTRAHHASSLCCRLCIVGEKKKLYTSHDCATAINTDTCAGKAAAVVMLLLRLEKDTYALLKLRHIKCAFLTTISTCKYVV
jgi:hypothetical protein